MSKRKPESRSRQQDQLDLNFIDFIYDNKYFKLEGIDYTNWNNDDNYIIQYINTRLSENSP